MNSLIFLTILISSTACIDAEISDIIGIDAEISDIIGIDAEISDIIGKSSVKLFPLIDLETNGTFVISPLSIFKLMTSVSFQTRGKSREQVTSAFNLPKKTKTFIQGYGEFEKTVMQPSDGVRLFTQNFMFIDDRLKLDEMYENKIVKPLSATPKTIVKKLDFNSNLAAVQANDIIKKSGANITDVLTQINFDNSRLILTNVITFKGLWSFPFNESDTTVESFYDDNGKEIGKVNMMYQNYPFRYTYIQSLEASVLELPYGNDGRYCMLVVLPYENISVRKVYNNFKDVTYVDIFNELQNGEDEFGINDIDVRLPRFKISTNIVLNKPLSNMGIIDIFESDLADFGKMTKEEIYISAIVHKADIEVTESGTVASAATSAYFANRSRTPEFNASRPFIYLIMEKNTKTVIFNGIYSQPSLF